jgi:hypothetical protein
MRRTTSVVTALVIGGLALVGARSDAGPDKIAFPEGFQQRLDLYTIADRYDVKQYRELFASQEAIGAARAGQPPRDSPGAGQYKAQVGAGQSLENDKGAFSGHLLGTR